MDTERKITEFVITYPHNGKMTIKLENIFELDSKGKLVRYTKTAFHKLMSFVREYCTNEQKEFLYNWLQQNAKPLLEGYTKTFLRVKKRGK